MTATPSGSARQDARPSSRKSPSDTKGPSKPDRDQVRRRSARRGVVAPDGQPQTAAAHRRAAADEIRSQVDFGRARVLINPDHASGMASSLRAGLAALDRDVDLAMVILGDQPDVGGRLDRLLDLLDESGLPAAALSFGSLLHPPVVLRRELWGDLMALEGDVGCRAVIRARPELVARLADEALNHSVDVDTPDDYKRVVDLRT